MAFHSDAFSFVGMIHFVVLFHETGKRVEYYSIATW